MSGKRNTQLEKSREEKQVARNKAAAAKMNLQTERRNARTRKVRETGFAHGFGFWSRRRRRWGGSS